MRVAWRWTGRFLACITDKRITMRWLKLNWIFPIYCKGLPMWVRGYNFDRLKYFVVYFQNGRAIFGAVMADMVRIRPALSTSGWGLPSTGLLDGSLNRSGRPQSSGFRRMRRQQRLVSRFGAKKANSRFDDGYALHFQWFENIPA